MKPWIRLWSEVLHDPKAQLLEAETFRTWINLLLLASGSGGRFQVGKPTAWKLQLPIDELGRRLKELIEAGLIDEDADGLAMHGWRERQFESDDVTTRVERHRQKRLSVAPEKPKPGSETFHVTNCNVSETRNETFQNQHCNVSKPVSETFQNRDCNVSLLKDDSVSETFSDTDTDTEQIQMQKVPQTEKQPAPAPATEPDPSPLIRNAINRWAEVWPEPGSIPRAISQAEFEFGHASKPIMEWLSTTQESFDRWQQHHAEKRFRDRKHFIPQLARWFQDGDYARKPPGYVRPQGALFAPPTCARCSGLGVVYPNAPDGLQGEARLDWLAENAVPCECGGAA